MEPYNMFTMRINDGMRSLLKDFPTQEELTVAVRAAVKEFGNKKVSAYGPIDLLEIIEEPDYIVVHQKYDMDAKDAGHTKEDIQATVEEFLDEDADITDFRLYRRVKRFNVKKTVEIEL